jgi:hypothetical protein
MAAQIQSLLTRDTCLGHTKAIENVCRRELASVRETARALAAIIEMMVMMKMIMMDVCFVAKMGLRSDGIMMMVDSNGASMAASKGVMRPAKTGI